MSDTTATHTTLDSRDDIALLLLHTVYTAAAQYLTHGD